MGEDGKVSPKPLKPRKPRCIRSGSKRKEIRPVLQKKKFAKLILPAWVVVIPNAAKAKANHIHHPVRIFHFFASARREK